MNKTETKTAEELRSNCEGCKDKRECHDKVLGAVKALMETDPKDWPITTGEQAHNSGCDECPWTSYCVVINRAVKETSFYWPKEYGDGYCVARSCFSELTPKFSNPTGNLSI